MHIGLLAAVIAFAWSWRPSYWYDEAASLSAAQRSPGQLWALLQRVDAVHGVYYYVLREWIGAVGTREAATRLLSVVGLGVACAGVSILGQRIGGRRLGLTAGLIAVVLPGLAWAGTELREYSWSAAGAVAVTLAFLAAMTTGRSRAWALYAIAIALATHLFLFILLLLPCHLLTLVILKKPLRRWCVAAAASVVATAPFLSVAWSQRGMTSWIHMGPVEMLERAGLRQYFLSARADYGWGVAIVCAVLLLALSIWLTVAAFVGTTEAESKGLVLALTVPWTVLPTVTIVIYSLVRPPIYQERYTTFCAPGLAILLGFGLLQLRERDLLFGVACLLLIVLPLPILVQQKGEASKGDDDYRKLANFVANDPEGVDAVVYSAASARSVPIAYPQQFDGVAELNAGMSPTASSSWWGTITPPRSLDPGSVDGRRVALIALTKHPIEDVPFARWLERRGCRRESSASGRRMTVYLFAC